MLNLNHGSNEKAAVIATLRVAERHGLVEDANIHVRQVGSRPDIVLSDGHGIRYVVEVKVVRDGRADRVIPQLSLALLQASHYAKEITNGRPMAVVYVSNVIPSMIRHVMEFADTFAENSSVGIVTEKGESLMRFSGGWLHSDTLEGLMREPDHRRPHGHGTKQAAPFNPFSDLNQWMLKVLLAPEIKPDLLHADRDAIYSGADLARAAGVSPMSANRLLQYLKKERHLVDGHHGLTLGRRKEFFNQWRSASMTSPAEYRMRFRARVAIKEQFEALLASLGDQACLGLFSAAEQLGMGHVSGVPPYVYLHRLPVLEANRPEWKNTGVCQEGQAPDFIVRRALAPVSTFRGAVAPKGLQCTDVIQVWLDVISHPTRGAEQAEHIYHTVLQPIMEAEL